MCSASGVGLARMVGRITYLSDISMGEKLAETFPVRIVMPRRQLCRRAIPSISGRTVQWPLRCQYCLLMTRALDYFDPTLNESTPLSQILSATRCKFLVLSFTTDWRFSPSV